MKIIIFNIKSMNLPQQDSLFFEEEEDNWSREYEAERISSPIQYQPTSFFQKLSIIHNDNSIEVFLGDSNSGQFELKNDYESGGSGGKSLTDEKLEFEGGKTSKKKRVDNTLFKTSLSSYRKSILQIIRPDPTLQWLEPEIKKMEKLKNKSVFPKMHIMMHQLGLIERIRPIWIKQSKLLLYKKKKMLEENKFSEQRYNQLQKDIQCISKLFDQELEEIIQEYWGDFRQSQKFINSKNQVLQFQKYFINKVQQQRDCQQPIFKEMKAKGKKKSKKIYQKIKKSKIVSISEMTSDVIERTFEHEIAPLPFLPFLKQNCLQRTHSSDFVSQEL